MYKIIELEQNTPEWHLFRDSHLGASDAPIVCGASPWQSPEEWLLVRAGFKEKKPMTSKMQRGHDLEPVARELLIKESGINFTPMVLESVEYPFLSCSLDGFSDDRKVIGEIKCTNKQTHEMAVNGNIPVYYNIQIQDQLFVSDAEYCIYFSYRPQDKIRPTALVRIERNEILIKEILKEEINIWDRLLSGNLGITGIYKKKTN